MSVIQKIRDKYARIAVIAIAVSLLGFILMDAFAGRTGLFSGNRNSNTLGKVNGKTISHLDFDNKIKLQENQALAQGYQLRDEDRQQLMQSTWDQEVTNIIMNEEFKKLGLTVTDKELRDILYGSNPPQGLRERFTDPKTGRYDAIAAQQEINRALKDPTQKDQVQQYLDNLKNQRLMSKYMTLFTNTINYPKWFLEKHNVDNSLLGRISYVTVPYSTISDSAVKVTDEEIKNYIKAHREDFEQKEETRSISYILFSAAPSSSDSAAIRDQVASQKAQLAAATDPGAFLKQQGSELPYFDGYVPKSAVQVPYKDSILGLPKGGLFGPYLDVNQNSNTALYVVAKMIDSRELPDSVTCRHILLGTVDRQGQPQLPDSVAHAKADSIAQAIRNGASFDSLNIKYSTDEAAKAAKGEMTFSSTDIQSENFAKEFGQFILFDGKPGDKKVLKTQFGWHYIEILKHVHVEPHYKVAYLGKQILPSPETDQAARNQANLFAGDSRDLNSFNNNYEKNLKPKGITKLVATDINPMDFNIPGLPGQARSFIKKVFETDKGDVLGPERVGQNDVVAIVTEVTEPGLQSVNTARPRVEPLLKSRKKAEQITRNIGRITTLEEVSGKTKQPIQVADSLRFTGGGTLGYEPKVLGASFNPANKGKVVPEAIDGVSGVFVIRVDNVTTTPVQAASVEDQRKMLEMQSRQGLMNQIQQGYNPVIEVLKRMSNVKDYRSKFY